LRMNLAVIGANEVIFAFALWAPSSLSMPCCSGSSSCATARSSHHVVYPVLGNARAHPGRAPQAGHLCPHPPGAYQNYIYLVFSLLMLASPYGAGINPSGKKNKEQVGLAMNFYDCIGRYWLDARRGGGRIRSGGPSQRHRPAVLAQPYGAVPAPVQGISLSRLFPRHDEQGHVSEPVTRPYPLNANTALIVNLVTAGWLISGRCSGHLEHSGSSGAGSNSGLSADMIVCLTPAFAQPVWGIPSQLVQRACVPDFFHFLPVLHATGGGFQCRGPKK